jgi:polar amino acid transport system substrate-binding protein
VTASTVRRRGVTASLLAAAVAALAACTSSVYAPTALPSPTATGTSAPTPSPSPSAAPVDCGDPTASYAPSGPVPAPAALPAGSRTAEIRDRGRLIVGVSADSLLLGSRNPLSGQIEGFDIDIAKLVSAALFGDGEQVELVVITAADRIPALEEGRVDMVARNMTINCARWEQIAFSAEYYRAGQKLLVTRDSTADGLEDLSGQAVCAPAGSTSLTTLDEFPDVTAVPAATHTDCLVQFQQGLVQAITGDDTVLAGLAAQDPYAKVVGERFTSEPYGLGFDAEAQDLVRYVNAVLDRAKTDGTWQAIYDRWLGAPLGPSGAAPTSVYGR